MGNWFPGGRFFIFRIVLPSAGATNINQAFEASANERLSENSKI